MKPADRDPAKPQSFHVGIVGPGNLLGWIGRVKGGAEWACLFSAERQPLFTKKAKRPRFRSIEVCLGPWRVQGESRTWATYEEVPERFRPVAFREPRVTKEAGAATRWIAKDRAWRWYCRRLGIPFQTWHVAPDRRKAIRAARRAKGSLAI